MGAEDVKTEDKICNQDVEEENSADDCHGASDDFPAEYSDGNGEYPSVQGEQDASVESQSSDN